MSRDATIIASSDESVADRSRSDSIISSRKASITSFKFRSDTATDNSGSVNLVSIRPFELNLAAPSISSGTLESIIVIPEDERLNCALGGSGSGSGSGNLLPVLFDYKSTDYNIEGYVQLEADSTAPKDLSSYHSDSLDDDELAETNTEYNGYANYFQRSEHYNFVGKYEDNSDFALSLRYDALKAKIQYIYRTKEGNTYDEMALGDESATAGAFARVSERALPAKRIQLCQILNHVNCGDKARQISQVRPVMHPMLADTIAAYDKKLAKSTFAFGLIYQKRYQTNEKDIFSNTTHSEQFDTFLDFLGERVPLKNFTKFRGGLDTLNDDSGVFSLYTSFEQSELMFHVSTMLPHSDKDEQKLEIKKHIGNDRVAIVFQDEDTPFSPKMIKSKLLHVFLVIQPFQDDSYKLSIISKKDVPYFGPSIRKPFIFKRSANLRRFILAKLINGEYASLRAPAFSVYSEKVLEDLLASLCHSLEHFTDTFLNFETLSTQYSVSRSAAAVAAAAVSPGADAPRMLESILSDAKSSSNVSTSPIDDISTAHSYSRQANRFRSAFGRLSSTVYNNFLSDHAPPHGTVAPSQAPSSAASTAGSSITAGISDEALAAIAGDASSLKDMPMISQIKGKNRSFTSSLKIKKSSHATTPLFSQSQSAARNESFFKLPSKSDMSSLIHKTNNITVSPLLSMLKTDKATGAVIVSSSGRRDDDLNNANNDDDILPEKQMIEHMRKSSLQNNKSSESHRSS